MHRQHVGNNDPHKTLVTYLIEELERARDLLFSLGDEMYAAASNGTGSVGGHVRHNLNFVDAVLGGVETGVIDYNDRIRDPLIETNRLYAASKIEDAIGRLSRVPLARLRTPVEVVSETIANVRHLSTVSRELEFVHSHTVHHHALIAEKLAAVGIKVERNFGVAPSTLEYWKRSAA